MTAGRDVSGSTLPGYSAQEQLERCHRESTAIEQLIRAGHPDLQGLCLALADWGREMRLILRNAHPGMTKPAADEAGRAKG